MRTAITVLLLGGICAAQDASREKPPETTFKVGSELVVLNVSVADKEGKLIKDIPQSAFTVYENNVKQEIKVFRQEDVPVSMGLIVDTSASMRDKRDQVASAALAMVKASNPDDEEFIINFNEEATLSQEFTSDLKVLEKGLRDIRTQGETAMRDALLLGIEHLRHKAKRDKRVLVVITDGDDNSSIETQQHLIEAAQKNNAIIYGVGLLAAERPEAATRAKQRLTELTQATGGRAWFPNDVAEISAITPEIAHEIRNQYIVGYTPPENAPAGSFRPVKVEVNVPGATVRTRSGYYARP